MPNQNAGWNANEHAEGGGGMPQPGVYDFVNCRFVEFNYGGASPNPSCALQAALVGMDYEGVQHWSLGPMSRFQPSADGNTVESEFAISKNSNFSYLMAGFNRLGVFIQKASDLDGLSVELTHEKVDRGQFGVKDVLVPVRLVGGGAPAAPTAPQMPPQQPTAPAAPTATAFDAEAHARSFLAMLQQMEAPAAKVSDISQGLDLGEAMAVGKLLNDGKLAGEYGYVVNGNALERAPF